MCNAHFQHLFDDASYSTVDIAQQQQQQSQQQNTRSPLGLHPHGSSTAGGQDNSAPTLSPVSTSGWSYPIEAQSDVQMYSPASTTSYSSFHSPVDTSTRVYALAGALQQQQQHQQHQQSNAGYPESSQRSTELTRGGVPSHDHGGAGQGRAPAQFFPEVAQQVTQQPHQHQQQQRWGYAGHAHAHAHTHAHTHAHEFSQEALSMSRAPIIDAQVQPPSASDDSVPHDRIPPVFTAGNVPGGARLSVASSPGAAGDQRPQSGARQIHQGVPLNERAFPQLQPDHHHRAMSSQSQHPHHQQQQHQQWLPQAQTQQMGGAPFLQVPTPRAVNTSQPGAMRNFFPYNSAGGNVELDYELESDDFGDHEEFDDGLDDEDASGGPSHLGIPTNGSPTPELQFPQGVSGTPSDVMRANFMLYGANPANWPMESLGGLAGSGSFMDTNAGPGPGPATTSSSRASSGGKVKMTPPEFLRPSEKRDKGKRAQGTEESEGQTVKVLIESATPGEPPKKVKMHQCRICQKLFPRPSGLATHMNSHSGARPFKCPLALCPKTFAVRSNARRHLRTHGITVPPNAMNKNGQGRNQEEPFQVGFETPVVVDVQDPTAGGVVGEGAGASAGGRPPKLRWVPPSLATRTNAPRLRSLSPASDMADLDAQDVSMASGGGASSSGHTDLGSGSMMFSRRVPGLRIAPSPLPPAIPSSDEGAADLNARFEERNSYAETGTYPYHPDQWRSLPGPGLVLALRS
ncbi:hypothetical protein ACEPAF_1372 [Sanghuangporus sanghuang]